MVKFFFNKKDELKKWVVIVFHLLLPVIFGIWGIYLSKVSLNLSRQMNDNREQIDTLGAMVKQLRQQNILLQKSVELQDSQSKAYFSEIKYSKRPLLRAQMAEPANLGEPSDLHVKITNSGGSISNLVVTPIRGVKIDLQTLPKNGVITSGATCLLHLSNLKNGAGIRLFFSDELMNKYSQDLIWTFEGESFQFGMLREINK